MSSSQELSMSRVTGRRVVYMGGTDSSGMGRGPRISSEGIWD